VKKKHRDIVVEGVTYGWIPGNGMATIYKDKKVWFEFHNMESNEIIPSMIAGAIKVQLKVK
jgi:hypothetical protein